MWAVFLIFLISFSVNPMQPNCSGMPNKKGEGQCSPAPPTGVAGQPKKKDFHFSSSGELFGKIPVWFSATRPRNIRNKVRVKRD